MPCIHNVSLLVECKMCEAAQMPPRIQLYLSRRNLETLLAKLDANREEPGVSVATIVKNDVDHEKYPASRPNIHITAVEDEEYYRDRRAGMMHPREETVLIKKGLI